ncbi:YesL family protein [Brachybacterium alimentarium]|uniref:YesL family protein n=1 Tax=Brachybacterium alimentarium TaxID=47845 RepID=UPI003FD67A9F
MNTASRTTWTAPRSGGLLAGIDLLLGWVVRLVWLNFWWLLLSLAGGILLGIGPATVAAHQVAATWARGQEVHSVPHVMTSIWRRCWWPANRVALLAGALVGALALTWLLSRSGPPLLAAGAQGACLVGLLVMAAIIPHLIWLSAAELRERESGRAPGVARVFTAALAVAVSRPVLTVLMAATWIVWPVALVLARWPGLLPVCGASVPLLVGAWCLARVSVAPDDDPPPSSSPPRPLTGTTGTTGTTIPERI